MGNDTKAPGAFQALRDALPTLRGWKFDRAEPTDEDGIAAVGTTWEDSEDFAPILSVDAGLYHQGELALPLAQAISAILCAAPALLAEVDRCHRSLKAAGFTDHGGEAWEPPIPKEATTLVNMLRESQAEVDRLTAENDALHHNANILQTALTLAQVDADRWQGLYRRAINEANGLTNYTEDRPELRRAEKNLTAIEAEARALMAARSTNV